MNSTANRSRVLPVPDRLSAPFWEGTLEGELRIQRCSDCERYQFPPRDRCGTCLGSTLSWIKASGAGRIAGAAYVTRRFSVGVEPPYVVLLVELAEQDDLCVWANYARDAPVHPEVGLAVTIEFERVGDVALLRAAPAR